MLTVIIFAITSISAITLAHIFKYEMCAAIYFAAVLIYSRYRLDMAQEIVQAEWFRQKAIDPSKARLWCASRFLKLGLVHPRVMKYLLLSSTRTSAERVAATAVLAWTIQLVLATSAGYLLLEKAPY